MNIKDKIIRAFFDLMQGKEYKSIKVTDIVNQAGVSRESYYRNFNSKEDIVIQFLDNVKEEMEIKESNSEDILKEQFLLQKFEEAFVIVKKYKREILSIYQELPNNILQKLFNEFTESFIGDMPNDSAEKYKLYFISGASLNIVIEWIENGTKEDPIEMAKMCINFMNGII